MHQSVPVQMANRIGHRPAQREAFRERQRRALVKVGPQRARRVALGIRLRPGSQAVRQFHHVIKISGCVVAADLQNIDHRRVLARDRLEPADAVVFPVERLGVLKGRPAHDLHRPKTPQRTTRQPHLPITA